MIKKKYFAAPSAIIESKNIGQGTKIWHFSHIMPGAKIGKNCIIGKYVSIEKNVKIGNNVKIQNHVSVFEGVIIEDSVFVGPCVAFTNVKRPRIRKPGQRPRRYLKTTIQKGASIGANATILPGITIGQKAMIGAGAVVTKDVPAKTTVIGNPAKELKDNYKRRKL